MKISHINKLFIWLILNYFSYNYETNTPPR